VGPTIAHGPESAGLSAFAAGLVEAGRSFSKDSAGAGKGLAQPSTPVRDRAEACAAERSLCAWRMEKRANHLGLLPTAGPSDHATGARDPSAFRSLTTNGQHNGQHGGKDHKDDHPASAEVVAGR